MTEATVHPQEEGLTALDQSLRQEFNLSDFLTSKLLNRQLSAPISTTCLLENGLALCLESRNTPNRPDVANIAILYPLCVKEFPTGLDSPVVSMVDMGSYLLVFTKNSYVALNLDKGVLGPLTPLTQMIKIAVRASIEEILIGFQSGDIETYRWEMRTLDGEIDRREMGLVDAHTSYKGTGGAEVSSIFTVQKESWFLATYSDNTKFAIWKYGEVTPIYRFSPTRNAQIPSLVRADTPIPEGTYSIFVSPTAIVFHNTTSGGNFAIEMREGTYNAVRKLSSLDSVCYRAKSEGVVTFNLDPYAVFFTSNIKPNEWLKEECTKRGNLVNVSLPVDFTKAEISENGAYLYLIWVNIVYTLPLAAVETQFTHAFSDQSSYLRGRKVIYRQFSCLYDSTGTEKVHIPEGTKVSLTSNDSFYSTCSQDNDNWKLFTLPDHTLLHHEAGEAPQVAVSEDSLTVALVCKEKLVKIDVTANTAETVNVSLAVKGVLRQMELFLKPANLLFAFCQRETAKLIFMEPPDVLNLQECENYQKITDVSGDKCDFLAILDTEIAYFSWENNKWQKTESQPTTTYLSLQAFGQGKYCTAELEKGCNVLTLPDFTVIMAFGKNTRLRTNRESEVFISYGAERGQTDYMVCTCWDLRLGIPTYRIDLGLSALPMDLAGKMQDLTLQGTRNIERLWRLPKTLYNPELKRSLPGWFFSDSIQDPAENSPIRLVGVEYLPRYCIAVKIFSRMLARPNTPLDPDALRLMIYPYGVNLLHLLVNDCKPDMVREAFAAGARFLNSSFGTPIGICLQFQKEKPELMYCLEELLKGLTGLSASDPTEFLIALHCLGDDFPMLLKSSSSYLPSFLGKILVPLPQELRYNERQSIYEEMPLPMLRSTLKPDIAEIPASRKWWLQTVYFHEYRICPIPLSLEIKRGELLDVLKQINPSTRVLSTGAIMSLAQVKWKEIRLPMYLQSGLYWIVFALIVCRVFDYGNAVGVAAALLLLNSALLLVALCQIKTVDRADVKSDIWLVTDLLRSAFTYAWAVIPHHVWLAFPTIALNAFIGLTTLKAIDRTRILVQMILKVCFRTVPFVIIFIYSILSFGTLYAVTEEEKALNFYESWTTVFEMIMGNFDNSKVSTLRWFVFFTASVVNVIWLLNLIVALLGTHYDRFQAKIQSEDIKLQFELVYQTKSLINFLSKAKSRFLCKRREKSNSEYQLLEHSSRSISYLSVFTEKSQDEEESQIEPVTMEMIERLEQKLDENEEKNKERFQQVMEAIRRVNAQNSSWHEVNHHKK